MRPYETLVVLTTNAEEDPTKVLSRLTSIIQSSGGTIDANHDWGVRRMAYPIKKQSEGHYHLLEYTADPQIVKELERNLRIADGVLRYMSVQQEHTGLPEARSEEGYSSRREAPLSELRAGDDPGTGADEVPAPEESGSGASSDTAESEAVQQSPAPQEAGEEAALSEEPAVERSADESATGEEGANKDG